MRELNYLDTIVLDYLSGRLSVKRRKEFLQLMKESKDITLLSHVHDSIFDQIEGLSVSEVDRLHELLLAEDHKLNVKAIWKKMISYAAILLLLGFCSVYYYNNFIQLEYKSFNSSITEISEPHSITLSDGTIIDLDRNARIENALITDSQREITLYGSASFKVMPKPIPFKVKTLSGYFVEVLGTHFNVISEISQFDLLVHKGRVKISNNQGDVIGVFQQGDFMCVDGNNLKFSSSVQTDLDFDAHTIEEIIQVLNKYYDVNIVLDAQVKPNIKIKISFAKDLSITEVLTLLCEVNGLSYHYAESKIIIK